ncbi:hypothetical protein [Kineococcus glutinatus]|uniref:LGFP repeat-containing protein n=1 Tax=Kineococcus glutinatus TaxID=1070872 RepID=A0ABP9H532_9ACTN
MLRCALERVRRGSRVRRGLRRAGLLAVGLALAAGAAPAQADPRVGGDIGVRYEALGGAGGFLGQPLTPEVRTPNGRGAYVVFEHGSIYWSPATGAHEVHGAIRGAWAWAGWENGPLGFPVTDEVVTPDGDGAYNVFEGGSVYWLKWAPQAAHVVRGAIRDAWGSRGWELGRIGYPTSSEFDIPGGKRQNFQRGFVEWSPATGARIDQTLTAADVPGCAFAPKEATVLLAAHCFTTGWLLGRADLMGQYGSQQAVDQLRAHTPQGRLRSVECGPNPRFPQAAWTETTCTVRFSGSGAVVELDLSNVVGIMRNAQVETVRHTA